MIRLTKLGLLFAVAFATACDSGSDAAAQESDATAQKADASPQGAAEGDMTAKPEDQRALHAKYLARKPIMADLPEELMAVAKACREDEQDYVCRWGHQNLSNQDWNRIRAAEAEEARRQTEQLETLQACQSGEESALREVLPGRSAFYELVTSRPAFEEQPVDAMVIIGIRGNMKRKANKVLERGMAGEALEVQSGGPRLDQYSPNRYASRSDTEQFFHGYYTPAIEARMETPRPECDRLRNSRFTQSACRRDISVSVVRDWLQARGHQSVRVLVSGQTSWPEYDLLFKRDLADFDVSIDTNFDRDLSRNSTFRQEICALGGDTHLWLDYEFYVNTLFPNG